MATWKAYKQKWSACTLCPLHRTATEHVLYRGSSSPDILFIGEAPGPDENEIGLPFVGRSGTLLNTLIEEVQAVTGTFTSGFANILCCLPVKDPQLLSSKGNFRAPTKEEAELCRPHLLELVNIKVPHAFVSLGKATHALIPPPWRKLNYFNLQHPSYWLRTGGANGMPYKRAKHELTKIVKELLA